MIVKSLRSNNYSLGGTEVFASKEHIQYLLAEGKICVFNIVYSIMVFIVLYSMVWFNYSKYGIINIWYCKYGIIIVYKTNNNISIILII